MSAPASPRSRPALSDPCPCGSGQAFGPCCDPVLKQERVAATAEQLMRSRFTAHYLSDYRHLHRTYLSTARQPYVEEDLSEGELQWSRLVVHAHEPGPRPDTAFVDFTAYFRDGGNEHPLHEKSEFQRIDGQWFYTKSVRTGPAPAKAAPKVGRNDPCPCGSGRKFKQCCGK
ncbi:MAG: YchJ family protein [Verrucomicrobiota bacterium]